MNNVSCSQCGQSFTVPADRTSGFSHCSNHNPATISHTMMLELDDWEKLEVTYLDDELHFAVVTHEGLSPIPVHSVTDAMRYHYPSMSLYHRYTRSTRMMRELLFWLQDHESNNRKKTFTLKR